METNNKFKKSILEIKDFLKNKPVKGYIWMIEDNEPRKFDEEVIQFEELYDDNKPYNQIQEAYLSFGTYSIHIKNIDGKEHCYLLQESDFSDDEYKIEKEFTLPSHKLGDGLVFKQVYKKTPGISGNDYVTWQPVVRLFKGFPNSKNN